MTDAQSIANQFVAHYYTTFDTNRAGLVGLYRDRSVLTFEMDQITGLSNIGEKLTSLPFQKTQHRTSSVEAQSVAGGSAILILVTGQLLVDEEHNALSFAQSFVLAQDAGGQWYVANDLFKLVYA
ncbi:hypothetical protein VTJ83DRAFT_5476 [Remersonia thermophila]|uniref:Nuclear transport factor 2 n=1 Tax=Remersonia thermophila TaxID=72144 RepID=A0ABR4D6Y1_9PEZI